MSAKPIKRVAIVDCGKPAYVADRILQLISETYEIELTQDYDADYIFHSCMGYEVLKYSGIRIFVCGECVSPNFNLSDYALTYDQITFGDRYQWFPLIKLYQAAYAYLQQPRTNPDTILAQNRDFCAYVMSNTSNSAPEHIEIFDKLSAYKQVNSGGRWCNNVGGPVSNKLEFQSKHKFIIAFENQLSPGYLTEKFAEAAKGGSDSDLLGRPKHWRVPQLESIYQLP